MRIKTSQIKSDKVNWPEHLPKVIAFDLDGTLSDNKKLLETLKDKQLRGSAKFGKPIKEVIRGMRFVKKLGYKIAIYTARAKSEEAELVKWLKKHKVPYDYLWIDQKPPFIILVDDRVVDVQKKSWLNDLTKKLRSMCKEGSKSMPDRFPEMDELLKQGYDPTDDKLADAMVAGILSSPKASVSEKNYWKEMSKEHSWDKK